MSDGLELVELTKRFDGGPSPVDVLRGVSLSIAPGEALAITGPSGSGKRTLLHLVGALDRPTSGTIRLDGREPSALDEPGLAKFRNRTIGFVFQDHHLLPQFSVLENVLIPTAAFPGLPGAGDESRGRDLLERVGLGHRIDHRPAELSGGERQRAAVARALINSPSLLLCDEPTGSLDSATAASVGDLLFELHAAAGTIMIAVTHAVSLAARFPRRVELVDGRCVES